jgi:AAA15 family ATPase/GTPase
VFFQHKTVAASAWLPLEQESNGTRTIARFAPGILDALETGSVLAVDELESSLHPLLAMRLVQLFNNETTNSRGAQLIFTTHDTNLLGNILQQPLLRRDQVWLTEKDAEGATRLYPLTDYKPRKGENLERGYLQGRYGAIPFLGELLPNEES